MPASLLEAYLIYARRHQARVDAGQADPGFQPSIRITDLRWDKYWSAGADRIRLLWTPSHAEAYIRVYQADDETECPGITTGAPFVPVKELPPGTSEWKTNLPVPVFPSSNSFVVTHYGGGVETVASNCLFIQEAAGGEGGGAGDDIGGPLE